MESHIFGCTVRHMLLRLKEEQSIKVLTADKGIANVVSATDTYQTKMSSLNESGPYQRLKKDPTDPLTRKLSKKLLTANLETKQISLRGRLQQDETTTAWNLQFTKNLQGRYTSETNCDMREHPRIWFVRPSC